MTDFAKRFLDPALYQGENCAAPYFEGWYYRAEASDGRSFAVIPGISRAQGGAHSFIQLLDPRHRTRYCRFPAEAFSARRGALDVRIGNSRFMRDGYSLDIPAGPDGPAVRGQCRFSGTEYPRRWWNPGIMGPFSYVPFLECRHAVLLPAGRTGGSIAAGGETIDLSAGRGYIEKDWGHSFPAAYIWLQATHMREPRAHAPGLAEREAAFMLSVAAVPFAGQHFTGVIGFLWLDGRLRRFATYTGARVRRVRAGNGTAEVMVALPHGELCVRAGTDIEGILRAPDAGEMQREARESMRAALTVELTERGRTVFSGVCPTACFECGGDAALLDTEHERTDAG